jgi:two-component system OmpR family sensor kinase
VLVGLAMIAVVAIAAAGAVTVTTEKFMVRQMDERLLAFSGPSLLAAPVDEDAYPGIDEDSSREEESHGEPDGDEWWNERPSDALRGALTLDGEFLVKFEPNVYGEDDDDFDAPVIDPAQLSRDEFTYLTAEAMADHQYRVLAKPVPGGWEITALSLESVESTTHRLVWIESIGIGALLAGLSLVAWWVISLGISPMRRMVDASTRIANGDLDVRLEGASSGTESAALATSLNTMIGRLTDALAERERSEARLREFVADASHELRTPLTTVLGYAQLHRKGALSRKAEQADAWGRTEAEATRMKRLVEDMLELARYDAVPEMHIAPIDLTRVVAEVLSDAARAHPGVEFTAAPSASVTAHVDGDRLRQAIINVVANAAQHGASRATVSVSQHTADDEHEVRIEVVDDGSGMSPEVVGRATQRFVRGESSRSRSTGGAGLGLAITAAIVEAHDGRLELASVEGEGTRVGIVLPQPPNGDA